MSLEEEINSYTSVSGINHGAGSLPLSTLLRIQDLLEKQINYSAETGCGKSTIFLSNISNHHKVFCLDDRETSENSSVKYFMNCPATKTEKIETIYGSTQITLPHYRSHEKYDLVLIDGPHGYPFPELEYYYFYQHLTQGGLLILDDIHIPTIGRLFDFIAEDAMFELLEIVKTTAVFKRTPATMFDPLGDDWYLQHYNRRRMASNPEYRLDDNKRRQPILSEKKSFYHYLSQGNILIRTINEIIFVKNLDLKEVIERISSDPITIEQLEFNRKLQRLIQNSDYFDEEYYVSINFSVRHSGYAPAYHFLALGIKYGDYGMPTHKNFSAKDYLAKNPEAVKLGINALLHYEIKRQQNMPLHTILFKKLFSK